VLVDPAHCARGIDRHWLVLSALIWLLVFAAILITTEIGGRGTRATYSLWRDGAHVDAVVTGLVPQDHGGCRFAYRVGAVGYTTVEESCPHSLRVGDRVIATYERLRPQVAALGRPGPQLRGQVMFLVGAPTALAFAVGFTLRRRHRRAARA
jgi:hypothetical protein